MTEKDLQERVMEPANRRYALFVFLDETTDGGTVYVATNPDLPGCVAQGDTIEEAESILAEVRSDYFAHRLAHHLPPVPETAAVRGAGNVGPGRSTTFRIIEPDDGLAEPDMSIAVPV